MAVTYWYIGGDEMQAVEEQLRKADPVQVVEELSASRAKTLLLFTRILIDQVGKEKATELIRKARYDAWYEMGQKAAEALANPRDIDSYINEYIYKFMAPGKKAYVPPQELERVSDQKAVFRTRCCFLAEALLKYGDKETLEVVKAYCCHDIAWANGFNPKMKFEMTKFFLDGDDCCEFAFETE